VRGAAKAALREGALAGQLLQLSDQLRDKVHLGRFILFFILFQQTLLGKVLPSLGVIVVDGKIGSRFSLVEPSAKAK